MQQNGVERPYEEILAELRARDEMDSNRHASPLKAAADALVINTDGLTLDEVIERVRAAADAAE